MTRCLVRWDTYRDSVDLMRVATLVEKLPGVSRAALMMATPANRELLEGAGLLDATRAAARLLDEHAAVAAVGWRPSPRSIAEAAGELPHANLAIISIPGTYETAEALKALKRGLHAVVSAPGGSWGARHLSLAPYAPPELVLSMLSSVLNATQVPHIARTGMKTTTEYIELVEEAFEAMNLSISVVRPV